ncbi:interferon-induced transmembrane protein [Motilibacter rhizosphaerae]|uniref:Interferon-induced transmembrane protein n=1 Tax=Motilibacter rhizosphaerae TaxID=598652 RepID=A0A4Q7NAF1_9ACTN|nr:toll/interleukin-1 receptor domain-containing protein [Motilibacter rhizosphaerae]RZS79377.1 interferon-induced transmembrane protein [Motilibacter rhizosphaerae]
MSSQFLSYVRRDEPAVRTLAAALTLGGYAPFFDGDLKGGQDWWGILLDKIEAADAFVPVLSEGYATSQPCQLEAEYAAQLGKPFLPLALDGVSPGLFPPSISRAQWVHYSPTDPATMLRVVAALNGLPPAPPLPDPRPPRPDAPAKYMNLFSEEIGAPAEIRRERQLVIVADLKARLLSDDHDAVVFLLRQLRSRPDVAYQAVQQIDEVLQRVATPRVPAGAPGPGHAPGVRVPLQAPPPGPRSVPEVTTTPRAAPPVVTEPPHETPSRHLLLAVLALLVPYPALAATYGAAYAEATSTTETSVTTAVFACAALLCGLVAVIAALLVRGRAAGGRTAAARTASRRARRWALASFALTVVGVLYVIGSVDSATSSS